MIVIGAGRVGTSLRRRAVERDQPCTLVSRTEGWDAVKGRPGTPIMVTVRNDDLDKVVDAVPAHRRDDLVFVQNGMIRPWLRSRGLAHATRGLLYFAARARDGAIEPGDASPFCGVHANEMVGWFIDLDLEAIGLNWARFSRFELEKLIWNTAFGLLCEHLECDVGTVCADHRAELEALVAELSRVGRASLGLDVPLDFLVDRLCAYSSSIPDYRGSVKSWPWRNGWFLEEAKRYRVATPRHEELLRAVGKLPAETPQADQ